MNWFRRPDPKPLRLVAENPDDLPAISALVQDAALRFGDVAYDPKGRHVTLRMNRFCHEIPGPQPLRAPSVLRICGVERVQLRGLDPKLPHQPLSLLDVASDPRDPPACVLTLRFAGEAVRDLRIDAECIDVVLMDLSPPRRAKMSPNHG